MEKLGIFLVFCKIGLVDVVGQEELVVDVVRHRKLVRLEEELAQGYYEFHPNQAEDQLVLPAIPEPLMHHPQLPMLLLLHQVLPPKLLLPHQQPTPQQLNFG